MPEIPTAAAAAAGAVLALALLAARASSSRSSSTSAKPPTSAKAEPMSRDEFKQHFADIKSSIKADVVSRFEMPAHAVAHIDRMLEYTVPGGKVNRGMTVVSVVERVAPHLVASAEDRRRVAALGWTIEFMQASFLVADDMMDSSLTRRGAKCWYLVDGIGKTAINDSLLLLTLVDVVLAHHVRGPAVPRLHGVLMDTTFSTELGQLLDLTTQPPGGPVDLTKYTLDTYKRIVKYKTAFYTFVAPLELGLVFAGLDDARTFAAAREVSLAMGEYFQIQDDVLDVYGDPAVIGKIGTDIQDAKCSWLVVQALSRANPAQRAAIHAHYGKSEPASVAEIKRVFAELQLQRVFDEYEQNAVRGIEAGIARVPDPRVADALRELLGKIYKRER